MNAPAEPTTGTAADLPGAVATEAATRCRSGGAILEATLEILAERGLEGLTMDGVAARAKVGKATIYRHWHSRAVLVMDAMASLPSPERPAPTGDLHTDLTNVFWNLARMLNDPRRSRLLSAMVDAAERDPELAELHARHSVERRAPARAVLAAAVDRGDLPPDTDVDFAVDLLAGPLFYRRLLAHHSIDRSHVEKLVSAVIGGLRSPT